jgi:hypothetical protein
MKVVCIDDRKLSPFYLGKKIGSLTTGKIYDAIDQEKTKTSDVPYLPNESSTYKIIDDNGQPDWYNDDVLMPLEKYRELKLKELGI